MKEFLLGLLMGLCLTGWSHLNATNKTLDLSYRLDKKDEQIEILENKHKAHLAAWQVLIDTPIRLKKDGPTGNILLQLPQFAEPITFIGVCRPEKSL